MWWKRVLTFQHFCSLNWSKYFLIRLRVYYFYLLYLMYDYPITSLPMCPQQEDNIKKLKIRNGQQVPNVEKFWRKEFVSTSQMHWYLEIVYKNIWKWKEKCFVAMPRTHPTLQELYFWGISKKPINVKCLKLQFENLQKTYNKGGRKGINYSVMHVQ